MKNIYIAVVLIYSLFLVSCLEVDLDDSESSQSPSSIDFSTNLEAISWSKLNLNLSDSPGEFHDVKVLDGLLFGANDNGLLKVYPDSTFDLKGFVDGHSLNHELSYTNTVSSLKNEILSGSFLSWLSYSNDYGETFKTFSSLDLGLPDNSLIFDVHISLSGKWLISTDEGLVYSDDKGESFFVISNLSGFSAKIIKNKIFYASSEGLKVSSDFGITFSDFNLSSSFNVGKIYYDVNIGLVLSASYDSIDGINTLGERVIITDLLSESFFVSKVFKDISDIHFIKNTLFVGTSRGLFASKNYGKDFIEVFTGQVKSIDSGYDTIVISGIDGLYKSDF